MIARTLTLTGLLLPAMGMAATQPSSAPASQPTSDMTIVSTLFGEPIYRWQIEPSEPERLKYRETDAEHDADNVRTEPGRRLSAVIGRRLFARFKEESNIEATDEDIRQFRSGMESAKQKRVLDKQGRLQRIEQEMARSDLTPREREDLDKDLERTKRSLKLDADMQRKAGDAEIDARVARSFVESWKVQKALHEKYGGRIIWQQAGIEALDAMRRLLEEAEQRGDFTILDERLRDGFYHYFRLKHSDVTDVQAFDRPWWLKEPDPEPDIRFGRRRVPPVPIGSQPGT